MLETRTTTVPVLGGIVENANVVATMTQFRGPRWFATDITNCSIRRSLVDGRGDDPRWK